MSCDTTQIRPPRNVIRSEDAEEPVGIQSYIVEIVAGSASDARGEVMQLLAIDLQQVTPDLLQRTDNPVLRAALEEAIKPTSSIAYGAGFNNKL
jgi:hypothetical protein